MRKASDAEPGDLPVGAPLDGARGRLQATPLHQSLWLWVAAGFLFLGLLWTGMFMASRRADTRTVPLATNGGRP